MGPRAWPPNWPMRSLASNSSAQGVTVRQRSGNSERLSAGRLQVAVLGQFKRGKSTFLNALLGADWGSAAYRDTHLHSLGGCRRDRRHFPRWATGRAGAGTRHIQDQLS